LVLKTKGRNWHPFLTLGAVWAAVANPEHAGTRNGTDGWQRRRALLFVFQLCVMRLT
jgi:hypothetical protein